MERASSDRRAQLLAGLPQTGAHGAFRNAESGSDLAVVGNRGSA